MDELFCIPSDSDSEETETKTGPNEKEEKKINKLNYVNPYWYEDIQGTEVTRTQSIPFPKFMRQQIVHAAYLYGLGEFQRAFQVCENIFATGKVSGTSEAVLRLRDTFIRCCLKINPPKPRQAIMHLTHTLAKDGASTGQWQLLGQAYLYLSHESTISSVTNSNGNQTNQPNVIQFQVECLSAFEQSVCCSSYHSLAWLRLAHTYMEFADRHYRCMKRHDNWNGDICSTVVTLFPSVSAAVLYRAAWLSFERCFDLIVRHLRYKEMVGEYSAEACRKYLPLVVVSKRRCAELLRCLSQDTRSPSATSEEKNIQSPTSCTIDSKQGLLDKDLRTDLDEFLRNLRSIPRIHQFMKQHFLEFKEHVSSGSMSKIIPEEAQHNYSSSTRAELISSTAGPLIPAALAESLSKISMSENK